MDVLVLGGTGFIGPHIVQRLVSRGHRMTTFTRGRRQADLPESMQRLVGDRDSKDAVVRSCLFVSSTGVFYPYRTTRIAESMKTRLSISEEGADSFGVAKSQAEQIARDAFGAGAIIVRPTYIVGPGDTSDRFTYWPVQLARGGEVLAPGKQDDPSQFINRRAVGVGPTFRPIATTVMDTLSWWNTVPAERRAKPRFVLAPERKLEPLAAWRARAG